MAEVVTIRKAWEASRKLVHVTADDLVEGGVTVLLERKRMLHGGRRSMKDLTELEREGGDVRWITCLDTTTASHSGLVAYTAEDAKGERHAGDDPSGSVATLLYVAWTVDDPLRSSACALALVSAMHELAGEGVGSLYIPPECSAAMRTISKGSLEGMTRLERLGSVATGRAPSSRGGVMSILGLSSGSPIGAQNSDDPRGSHHISVPLDTGTIGSWVEQIDTTPEPGGSGSGSGGHLGLSLERGSSRGRGSADGMIIRFAARYFPLLSRNGETRPRLHFFLSRDFTRTEPLVVEPRADGYGQDGGIDLGPVAMAVSAVVPYVPRDLSLNVHVYVDVRNTDGEWCGNQAGMARIPVASLRRMVSEGRARRSSSVQVTLTLVVPCAKRLSKGKIALSLDLAPGRAEPLELTGVTTWDDPRPIVDWDRTTDSERSAAITSYMRDLHASFLQIPPTWTVIRDIHAYMYTSPAGDIPASLFDLVYPSATPEEYYRNALRIVLRRRGRDLDWFLNRASSQQVGGVVTEVTCVYVNWCKYITDLAYEDGRPMLPSPVPPSRSSRGSGGRTGRDGGFDLADRDEADRRRRAHAAKYTLIESFDAVRPRGSEADRDVFQDDPRDVSDCEDFAKEGLAELAEIRQGRWTSPEMRLAQANCRMWVDASCLGGVSSMKLENYETAGAMGAHEYVMRIPRFAFYDALERAAPSHILLKTASADGSRDLGRSEGLQMLVGEGTGLLYPDDMDDTRVAQARKWIEAGCSPTFKLLRKRYTFQRGKQNGFYQTCTSLFTSDFAISDRDLPYTEFAFVYPRGTEGGTRPHGTTYGVRFADVTSNSDSVGLLPQSPIPAEVRYYSRKVLKDSYPNPPLRAPTPDLIARMDDHPFVTTLRSGKRSSRPSSALEVVYFLRRHHATESLARDIRLCVDSKKIHVEVLPELATRHGLGGFYLLFYVDELTTTRISDPAF